MNTAETFVPFTAGRGAQPAEPSLRAKAPGRAGFVPGMPGAGPETTGAGEPAPQPPAPSGTPPHAAGPSATVVAPRPHADHGQPVVSLIREGEKVIGIRVQCTCGQVIELDCVY